MDNQTHDVPEAVIIPPAIAMQLAAMQSEKKKASSNAGRPTVMTDDILRLLKEAFLMDCTDIEACQYAGIGKTAFYDYQKEHPEFAEQKELWKNNPFILARKTLTKALEEDADIAIKYMERKKKDEFSTRQEMTGKDGDAIEMALDTLENKKTDYATIAKRAKAAMDTARQTQGQVVAADASVQN